jgi:hypothetical protein
MNFLTLVNRTISECGSALAPLSTLARPAAGETTRMINWVIDAWTEIQLEQYEWDWQRIWLQFPTVTNQQQYTPTYIFANATVYEGTASLPVGTSLAAFGLQQWVRKSFRIFPTVQGVLSEQIGNFMPWDDFRNIYIYANQLQNYTRPVIVSVGPDKSLWFGPIPDSTGYTITCEAWLAPQMLAVDTDVPLMPPQYHMAIVYKAMMKYARYESAPEVAAGADEELDRMMNKIYIDQLPVMGSGPPIATETRT